MSMHDNLDRRLSDWLQAEASIREPEPMLRAVLARTARTRQRPAWAILERWFPMTALTARVALPRVPSRSVGLVAALLVALLAGVLYLAGVMSHRRAPLTGPAGNGAVAIDVAGQIDLVQLDGNGLRPLPLPAGQLSHPSFSLDGSKIAYYVHRGLASTPTATVALANADGTASRPLSPDAFSVQGVAAWEPDGDRLLLPVEDQGLAKLVLMRTDTGSWAPLDTHGLAASAGAWSRDGEWIAFRGLSVGTDPAPIGTVGLYVEHPDGTGFRKLPASGAVERAFSTIEWAPDGSHRLTYYAGDGAHHVAVLDVDSGVETILGSADAGDQYEPSWSPDSTRIAINAHGTVLVVNADSSGQAARVPFGPDGMVAWAGPAWSPDGSRIFGFSNDADLRLVVVNADGTGQPTLIPAAGLVGGSSWQRTALTP